MGGSSLGNLDCSCRRLDSESPDSPECCSIRCSENLGNPEYCSVQGNRVPGSRGNLGNLGSLRGKGSDLGSSPDGEGSNLDSSPDGKDKHFRVDRECVHSSKAGRSIFGRIYQGTGAGRSIATGMGIGVGILVGTRQPAFGIRLLQKKKNALQYDGDLKNLRRTE